MSAKLLVVDDEKTIRDTLWEILTDEGFTAETAENGEQAVELIAEENFDLVISDLRLPGMDGLTVLQKTLELSPQTLVVIITAYASVDTAVEALKKGASDYLVKPLILDDVLFKIRHLLKYRQLAIENQILRQEVEQKYDFSNIIGESPQMKQVFELIKKIAPTNSNVLLLGESGTGKELVARALHFNSPRRGNRFVAVNCSAISEQLLESECFGHKKGAFTGALRDKDGYFKSAHRGTLFLDEVSEIPLHLQSKFLRAIQEKEIYPVGSEKAIKVDVRLVAASNRDLEEEVRKGNFREDLFYRLNVAEIKLPSLRERREDIPLLVHHFIEQHNEKLGKRIRGVDNKTMKILLNYDWKGNIRELENLIERAMIFCEGEFITPANLPTALTSQDDHFAIEDDLKKAMKKYERDHIIKILQKTGNNKRRSARLLGISESSLYRKMEELAIPFDMKG
ncbi:MAG: sigma-54-dependent Fis family transcriptional regulator [Calditrichaeota bacterium]|nr:MAG: sigma-54-dependent Fis family transcriptional regulator [Calditrichota bacterium]